MTRVLLGTWSITEAGTPSQPLGTDRQPENGVVDDVEALCRGVIDRVATSRDLSPADREELLSHLFERVVVLQRSYDPDRRGILFRPWLYRNLQLDAIDFLRAWLGRRGEKRVVDERVLNAGRGPELADGGGSFDTGPDIAAAEAEQLHGGGRVIPRAWLHPPRDRAATRSAA